MDMRMAALATVTGTLLWAGSGAAQDLTGPECGPFTLERTQRSMAFVDLGAEGKSPGDQRVMRNTLADQDGNELGSVHIISTLVSEDGPEGEDLLLAQSVVDLPNGTISYVTLLTVPAADESPGSAKPNYSSVTGGTGAFAHATGVMTTVTRDDGVRELSFDLRCG
jgi:hypothetical protein